MNQVISFPVRWTNHSRVAIDWRSDFIWFSAVPAELFAAICNKSGFSASRRTNHSVISRCRLRREIGFKRNLIFDCPNKNSSDLTLLRKSPFRASPDMRFAIKTSASLHSAATPGSFEILHRVVKSRVRTLQGARLIRQCPASAGAAISLLNV